MLEVLLGPRRHARTENGASPDLPPISRPPFVASPGYPATSQFRAYFADSTFTEASNTVVASYDGRFILSAKRLGTDSIICDMKRPTVGYGHEIVGRVADGGNVSGSLDMKYLWYVDYETQTTARLWKRSEDMSNLTSFSFNKLKTVALDPLGPLQSRRPALIVSGDGKSIFTGSNIKRFDEDQEIDSFTVGNDVLGLVFSETGQRFVTFKSTTVFTATMWEKNIAGVWGIVATKSIDRTFVKRVIDTKETTWLRSSGNFDLSRFIVGLGADVVVFDFDGTSITVNSEVRLRSDVTNLPALAMDRMSIKMNRSGDTFVGILTYAGSGSFRWFYRFRLNPATNTWQNIIEYGAVYSFDVFYQTDVFISGDDKIFGMCADNSVGFSSSDCFVNWRYDLKNLPAWL